MISRAYDEKILSWLEQHREEILRKWMELIRIPSVQDAPEENAPFGKYCGEAVRKAASYFAEAGFDVRVEDAEGYALADYGHGEKTIGLFAHCDVVPVGEGWIYTEPFAPVIRDGLLIGRGASDNKNGVMAAYCILSMLKDCGIPVKSRLRTFLGGNEESGMQDVEAFVRRESMPDLSLVPDSGFPCSIGEGGILRMWARSGRKLKTVLAFRGGSAFNVVLDDVRVTLAPNGALEAELREKTAGKDAFALSSDADGTLQLRVTGVSKHASDPKGSVNAACLAAALLAECGSLDREDRAVMAEAASLYGSPWGEGFGIAREDEYLGKLTAVNGMAALEEGRLALSLDVRYGVTLAPAALEAALSAACSAHGWEITELINWPGFLADPESPVPGIMKGLVKELTGNDWECFYMGGGTYARHLKNAFPVGTAAPDPLRKTPPASMPEGHGSVHQRDEAMDLENFFHGVRILAHAVLACDRAMNGGEA